MNKQKETVKLSSPVNIEQFIFNNQRIDTFKLQTEILNKIFEFDYTSYNHYAVLNTDVNEKAMFMSNNYLITGKDEKGNETVISFYTQTPNKGNKLWGQTFINQPKKYYNYSKIKLMMIYIL